MQRGTSFCNEIDKHDTTFSVDRKEGTCAVVAVEDKQEQVDSHVLQLHEEEEEHTPD